MSAQTHYRISLGLIIFAVGWLVTGVWWASKIDAQVSNLQEDVTELRVDVRSMLDGQRARFGIR